MSYTEMRNFIMESLDEELDYYIMVDMDYDEEPTRMGSDTKPFLTKEVRFEVTAQVNDISLGCDEQFREYEV
jgi:hypothetical protein